MSDLRKYDPSLLDRANTAIDPSQYGRGSIGRFGANLAQNVMDLLGLSDANYTPYKSGFNAEDMKTFAMNSIDVPEAKAVKNVAKRIMTPEIRAKNLERFLEGSKVREPVYHGTNAEFDIFDKDKIGNQTDNGIFGRGFYFARNEDVAKRAIGGGEAKTVKKIHLNISNPFKINDFKNESEIAEFLGMDKEDFVVGGSGIRPSISSIPRFTDALKDMGFDGVIVNRGGISDELIAFEPTQIKSATGNRGTFDPTDPNILHSIAPMSLQRYNTQKEE